jgi:hypothetical protein
MFEHFLLLNNFQIWTFFIFEYFYVWTFFMFELFFKFVQFLEIAKILILFRFIFV